MITKALVIRSSRDSLQIVGGVRRGLAAAGQTAHHCPLQAMSRTIAKPDRHVSHTPGRYLAQNSATLRRATTFIAAQAAGKNAANDKGHGERKEMSMN